MLVCAVLLLQTCAVHQGFLTGLALLTCYCVTLSLITLLHCSGQPKHYREDLVGAALADLKKVIPGSMKAVEQFWFKTPSTIFWMVEQLCSTVAAS